MLIQYAICEVPAVNDFFYFSKKKEMKAVGKRIYHAYNGQQKYTYDSACL